VFATLCVYARDFLFVAAGFRVLARARVRVADRRAVVRRAGDVRDTALRRDSVVRPRLPVVDLLRVPFVRLAVEREREREVGRVRDLDPVVPLERVCLARRPRSSRLETVSPARSNTSSKVSVA
jgi:hypothetical protein